MKKTFFLAFLLIFPFALAQTDDIFYSRNLLLEVSLDSGFILTPQKTGSSTDFVRVQLMFYPQEEYNQKVLLTKTSPESKQSEEYYQFEWESPQQGNHRYSLSSEVRTYNSFRQIDKKIDFPQKVTDPEAKEYLTPTQKIDINEDIIRKASEIAQGEDDLFIVAYKLASWTKQNIQYNLTTKTAEASQKASWVLENRYGVCDELTNLFIAMARSLGIPARFVSGISYSNSEQFSDKWGLHGWAEVYFQGYGWVPFDPTYGQYGQVDATHIKLKESMDSDKSSSRYEWQAISVDLEPVPMTTDVEIIEMDRAIDQAADIEIIPLSKEVSFSSYNLIEAKLKNRKGYYTAFEVSLSRPKEVMIIGQNTQSVALPPYGEKSLYWIVKTESSLQKNYIYTFPLEAKTSLGFSQEGSFKAFEKAIYYDLEEIQYKLERLLEKDKKAYSKNVDISCDMPEFVFTNTTFQIPCSITNKGNIFLSRLRICMDKAQCSFKEIGISQSAEIVFNASAEKPGETEYSVTASNGEVSALFLARASAEDKPELSIENLNFPETIEYGPEFNVKFNIWKHSTSEPENISVVFIFNDKETKWHIDTLDSNQGFDIRLDKSMLIPKENSFKISISYHNRHGTAYKEEIIKEMLLDEPGIFAKIEMFLNMLSRKIDALLSK